MSHEMFLNGKVQLCCGDSIHFLRDQPDNRFDSIVTDPPYALVSIGKRFGADGAAAVKVPAGGSGAYARASAGFMGKRWDTGETAFAVEFWEQCLRVLKPGGHVVAFGGTRTYHRLACAIEDAGFEIRDMVSWTYGSGFPKSHDVSKGIDKRKNWTALPRLQGAIGVARKALGISQSEAARRMGLIGPDESLGGGGFMWFETGMRAPTREQWLQLKLVLALGDEFDLCFEEAEREITGTVDEWENRTNYALTSKDGFRRDKPSSDAAIEWQGWGTALKPAVEPICLARKPLIGTVAANVLEHGTGAINIDGCRISTSDKLGGGGEKAETAGKFTNEGWRRPWMDDPEASDAFAAKVRANVIKSETLGRWPANLVHDGSEEVIAAFPESDGQNGLVDGQTSPNEIYGARSARPRSEPRGDSGSAARFFYTAKADSDDRLGSKHPTVKPVDLMQWLVRLVTPKGGLVLDPFAGTGTTAEACFREGMRCMLVERETEYQADIRRRMSLVMGGPDERRRESIKAKMKDQPVDAGPLFTQALDVSGT